MKWADVNDIAIELSEAHPDIDPLTVRFTDLHNWVIGLEGFDEIVFVGCIVRYVDGGREGAGDGIVEDTLDTFPQI